MKKKRFKKIYILLSVIGIIIVAAVLLLGGTFIYVSNSTDPTLDEELFQAARSTASTKFYYNSAEDESEYIPKEYAVLNSFAEKKSWYSYSKIGDNIKNAFLAAEDRDFFEHRGVDIKRTAFAAVNYIFKLKSKFGGSTITQQLIKNISGDDDATVSRKISEIVRAVNIESTHSKEEIFELYLNIVPMSEGIYGVGYAAEYYFEKAPKDLSIEEAATLVGITNAPSKYNPYSNPEACKEKRNRVLYAMLDFGVIDEAEYKLAIASELTVSDSHADESWVDSWFVETVLEDVSRDLARKKGISENAARMLVAKGGYSIYTTVDPKVQRLLESYFENTENFPKAVDGGLNYSMVITDSKNGDLLGIIGSVGEKSGNRLLNLALTPHTPGSAMKPLALYAPLINSKKANWATVFDDVPISFKQNENGEYTEYPQNSPKIYDGLTPLSEALYKSKNTVAVRIYNMLGKEKIFSTLKNKFGFDTLIDKKVTDGGGVITDKAVSPLALGQLSYGVSLRKLTEAYSVFSNEGKLPNARSYTAVYDNDGNLILENEYSEKRIFESDCAAIMNQMLMQVTERGTARSLTLPETVDTAGKTGTSGNDRDRLFVGYTPYCIAGIWCGYDNSPKSIGNLEKSHLEIWDEIMKAVHKICYLSEYEEPESFSTNGLKYLPYCKDSGELYSDICLYDPRGSRLEHGYFTEDNKPLHICKTHIPCLYDLVTGAVANRGCPSENLVMISLLDISERSFPKEITVTDAEYAWRRIDRLTRLGDSYDIPYFIYTLEEGEYVGRGKNKKQFNSNCYLHDG